MTDTDYRARNERWRKTSHPARPDQFWRSNLPMGEANRLRNQGTPGVDGPVLGEAAQKCAGYVGWYLPIGWRPPN